MLCFHPQHERGKQDTVEAGEREGERAVGATAQEALPAGLIAALETANWLIHSHNYKCFPVPDCVCLCVHGRKMGKCGNCGNCAESAIKAY